VGVSVVGCGPKPAQVQKPSLKWTKFRYGHAPEQFGQFGLPTREGPVAGTAVLIHGGGWSGGAYATSLFPLAGAMRRRGFAVWYLNYRGIGDGGEYPTIFEDIAAGCDHLQTLAQRPDLADRELMGRVTAIGHSAGGHLATWAASRRAETPGGGPAYGFHTVYSLAGPLCFTQAASTKTLSDTVRALMEGTPEQVPERYRLADPLALLPASSPVVAYHGWRDTLVPIAMSERYVARARQAGAPATFLPLDTTHAGILLWGTVELPKLIKPLPRQ